MLWFVATSALGGIVMGWLFVSVLGIIASSTQILLVLAGLWFAGQLTLWEFVVWASVSLCSHQFTYLFALILRDCTAKVTPTERVISEMEGDLELLDSLAKRIEARAPDVQDETDKLTRLGARMREKFIAGELARNGHRRRNSLNLC